MRYIKDFGSIKHELSSTPNPEVNPIYNQDIAHLIASLDERIFSLHRIQHEKHAFIEFYVSDSQIVEAFCFVLLIL